MSLNLLFVGNGGGERRSEERLTSSSPTSSPTPRRAPATIAPVPGPVAVASGAAKSGSHPAAQPDMHFAMDCGLSAGYCSSS